MSLFKNQIKTLIATMSKVKEVESFDMGHWHQEDDKYECGFAACICGFQAAEPKSGVFRGSSGFECITSKAGSIAIDLDVSCEVLMGENLLAHAIYTSCEDDRYDNAYYSNLFTNQELKHPHLTKQNPTPADAISFMELVLTKLDDIK